MSATFKCCNPPQAQAGQQGFTQKTPAGDNGQEMRFVNDNQMVVDVQDFFFKRNDGFAVAAGFAVIKHGFAGSNSVCSSNGAPSASTTKPLFKRLSQLSSPTKGKRMQRKCNRGRP